ncbi:MAG: ferrous iron transport protein B [Bacteroidaceae bacterium]
MTLNELKLKESATILRVGGDGALRQHFLDMGMIPGVEVTLEKRAPMGDPVELRLHGFALALRLADAEKIEVTSTLRAKPAPAADLGVEIEHPGLGEGGRYHEQDTPDKDNRKKAKRALTLALVGNQNCGKTTLFNQLTGATQHVGNFPGVTVERKDGLIKGHPEATVTDLPGIYSLSPYTSEEVVSRQFILEQHPSGIINIVDATNLERNLYLTMQLMELNIPMVLALNMMDELKGNGGAVRINEMEQMLGIPVIPISAMRNEGVDEVVRHALHVARYEERPQRHDFCSADDHGGAVHRCLHAIMHLVEDHAQRAGIPLRFAASKLMEGDRPVTEALKLNANELETVEHILQQMEEERGLDRKAAIADMRYSYIEQVSRRTLVKPHASKEYLRSKRIDSILTGRFTAIPAFLAIMASIFWLTFNGLGAWLQDLFQEGIDWFTDATDQLLLAWNIAPAVHSLIIDGIYNGVGTVLVFLPMIVVLFFFLSILEDSGYMARIAFVMDKLLRKMGLSGRSIVPLLIGFGCSVPSVMASRTLPSARDRKLTILLTPFMSCTAKIPVYAFFATCFFPDNATSVMMAMYLIGILAGIGVALVFKHTLFRGEPVPFVMELPNYRMPVAINVMRLLWEKAKDFLQRAFTVIFLASMIIWFMQTFNFRLQMVDPSGGESMLAQVAGLVAPLFEPLGFGDWRIVTALVSGFLAKEVVVSTLGGLFATQSITEVLTAPVAFALMVFCLLYTPCVATISTIRRELGRKWAWIVVCLQCMLAWLAAWCVAMVWP